MTHRGPEEFTNFSSLPGSEVLIMVDLSLEKRHRKLKKLTFLKELLWRKYSKLSDLKGKKQWILCSLSLGSSCIRGMVTKISYRTRPWHVEAEMKFWTKICSTSKTFWKMQPPHRLLMANSQVKKRWSILQVLTPFMLKKTSSTKPWYLRADLSLETWLLP